MIPDRARPYLEADAIAAEGINPDVFLLLNVPDDVLIERVVGRRLDPETGAIYHGGARLGSFTASRIDERSTFKACLGVGAATRLTNDRETRE